MSQAAYSFAGGDCFVVEQYNDRAPFASFLPGIAGPLGIPLWAFYVNRDQAIASFGVESKDNPIMEFQPANRAFQTTPYTGFRTFIKLRGAAGEGYYEPFSPSPPSALPRRERAIRWIDSWHNFERLDKFSSIEFH